MASIRWKYNLVDKLAPDLDAMTEKELRGAGEVAVRTAQARVRYDTGKLHDSIKYEVDGRQMRFYADMYYATYQEFGTWKMTAQPYMRPGVEAAKPSFERAMFAVGPRLGRL